MSKKKNKLFGGISSSNLLMFAVLGVGAYVIYKGFASSDKSNINPGTNSGNTTNNYNVEIPEVDIPSVVDKVFNPDNYLKPDVTTESQVQSAIQEAINKANGQ